MALEKTIIVKDRAGGSYITLVLDDRDMRVKTAELLEITKSLSVRMTGHKFPMIEKLSKEIHDPYMDMLGAYHRVYTLIKGFAKPANGHPFGINPEGGTGVFVWETSWEWDPTRILQLLEPLARQGFLLDEH